MALINSVYNRTEGIAFLAPKIWELIPEEMKQQESLNAFKDAIKNGRQQIVHVDYAKIFYMI